MPAKRPYNYIHILLTPIFPFMPATFESTFGVIHPFRKKSALLSLYWKKDVLIPINIRLDLFAKWGVATYAAITQEILVIPQPLLNGFEKVSQITIATLAEHMADTTAIEWFLGGVKMPFYRKKNGSGPAVWWRES